MSSSYDRISIYGLLQADATIFDNFQLPNDLVSQKEDIINNILMECYELEILYPDPRIMKQAIGLWSKKMKPSWERMLLALTEEYNPLHNFDRHEEYTDTGSGVTASTENTSTSGSRSSSSSGSDSSTSSGVSTADGTQTNSVMGFNESEGWADHDKEVSTNNGTSSTSTNGSSEATSSDSSSSSSTNNSSTSENKQSEHDGHLYGNIGVTKSQEMLKDEIEVRERFNIIDLITKSFRNTFCVLVY